MNSLGTRLKFTSGTRLKFTSVLDTIIAKKTKETATLIILQLVSCMLIVTTDICKGITSLYKIMKVLYCNLGVHL